MTDDLTLRQTFYAAFFAAHVAVIAIALPIAGAVLLPQAERYSVRILRSLLGDGVFLLLLVVILVSVIPSAIALYLSVVPTPDGSNVLPSVVLVALAAAVIAFLALFERARRVVQPRAMVRRAVQSASDMDWHGKALARFGTRRYEKPLSPAFLRALAALTDASGAADAVSEEAADPQDAHDALPEDEPAADGEEQRLLARRERLLETHGQREDALAGATGIALRAIEDHDIWTLNAYASAVRDSVLGRIKKAKPIATYSSDDVAVAVTQLVCHDHFTPLFAVAIRSDARAARVLLETMQEIAVGSLSLRPQVASHVVARLDNWLDDALREHVSEELVARWIRVLGVIGREAARSDAEHVVTHVVQALTHAGEILPSRFWTEDPHVYNHPEVEEPEAAYSFVVELEEALAGMRGESEAQGALTPAPIVEGTQVIASALMRRNAVLRCTSYRNERIHALIGQIRDDAKHAMDVGDDRFAVLPLSRLWLLHDNALKCEATDAHDYVGDSRIPGDPDALRDPHLLFSIRFALYEAGIVADSKHLPMAADYAFKGLTTPELTEGHIRSLYYEWVARTIADATITIDGVKTFTKRFCGAFNSNLGLKTFGATDSEADAAHRGDPDPYG